MRRFLGIAVAGAAMAIATPALAGEVIVDGGFDAGVGQSFGPAWSFLDYGTADANSLLRVTGQDYSNCCGAPGSPEARANYLATFGAGQSSNEIQLNQNFSASAGTYTFSFDGGAFGGAQTITFGIYDYALGGFLFTDTFSPTPTTDLDALLQHYSRSITLAGGNYLVGFTNAGSETINTDALVDNVSLVGGAVPEPATWAMMIAGFGMVGASMRRRQTRATVRFA